MIKPLRVLPRAAAEAAAVVAFGSNLTADGLGPEARIAWAAGRLEAAGLRLLGRSSLWRSDAWPDPSRPAYLNAVAFVPAVGEPDAFLALLHSLETEAGRLRGAPNADRTLDLDLIAFGREARSKPGLLVPHPRAADRLFVMGPLAEAAPDWRHPVLGETASALAARAEVGRDARPLLPFAIAKDPPSAYVDESPDFPS